MRAPIALFVIATALSAQARETKRPLPAPAVAVEPVFDAEQAARQVRARMRSVRACYEHANRRDPGIEGKLRLGLELGEAGQIVAADVELDGLRAVADKSIATELTSCVRSQALTWRLAPEGPAGGVHLSYVFVFAAAY
jgi:hypothetical protein